MNDSQVMTLALSIAVPLAMLIYSNSRINDAKEVLRAETQTLRTEVERGHAEVIASLEKIVLQIKAFETNIENKLKIHELEHHR